MEDRVLAPGYVAGLDRLELAEVRVRRDDAAQEETDLSYLRRLLHARIDIVHAEQRRRRNGDSAPVVTELARILAANALGPAIGSGRFQTMEPSRAQEHRRNIEVLVSNADLSDVGSLSDELLDATLQEYCTQETSVSQCRRAVQHVVDSLNAEIGSRYASGAASVDDLLTEQRRSGADNQFRPGS